MRVSPRAAGLLPLAGHPLDDSPLECPRPRRRAIAIALGALLLIAVPLTFTSYGTVVRNTAVGRVSEAAESWLGESAYRVVSVDAETTGEVTLVILGGGEAPAVDALQSQLQGRTFGRLVRVEVLPSAEYLLETW